MREQGVHHLIAFCLQRCGQHQAREPTKHAAQMRRLRRAKGVKPREQYLAESLARTKSWEAEGIIRRTWERRRRSAD
jgi:hypothetical protein